MRAYRRIRMNEAVGVDVSKAVLDVAIHGTSKQWSFGNDAKGRRKLVAFLLPLKPRQVVIEATGCYDLKTTDAMHDAGLPVVRLGFYPVSTDGLIKA